jgi:protein arginine kinase
LRFAFSAEHGFLTCCPTNVGTGIRVSVMLHLPALAMIDHIDRVRAAVMKLNLAVRGLYGEGSRAHGDFFQISNQITLGRTEADLISDVRDIIPQVIHYERSARRELLAKRRSPLEDRVWRSLGTLSSARRISSDEALDCLSSVRMGINLALIDEVPLETINELLLFSQPAHLQKLAGEVLDTNHRDTARARLIRSRLAERN